MRKSISGGLVGLSALAAVGNIIIRLPLTYNDGSDILSVLLSSAFSFLLIMFFYPLVSDFFSSDVLSSKKILRLFKISVLVFFQAVLMLIAITTLCDFSLFASKTLLYEVNLGFIFIYLGILGAVLGLGKKSALSKTAVVSLFAVVLLTVVIFVFSVPDMSFKYIKPRESFDVFFTLETSLSFFLPTFAESFVLVSVLGEKVSDKRSVMIGFGIGGVIILLAVLNTLLVFGGEFSRELSYPYISAVKTVGERDVFSGMEIFLYVTVFLTCVIKLALSVFGIKQIAKEISRVKKFNIF